MIVFYVFFELRALIIFLIVLRLGYQPERLEARLYLLLFTVFTSLPFFALIIYLGERRGITAFLRVRASPLRGLSEMNRIVSIILILGFLTKFPMYFVHV
jgi:formate hydrogenlyase subunit 3/multisubunit Na+/H+ antiporter MnhD subunit